MVLILLLLGVLEFNKHNALPISISEGQMEVDLQAAFFVCQTIFVLKT